MKRNLINFFWKLGAAIFLSGFCYIPIESTMGHNDVLLATVITMIGIWIVGIVLIIKL